MGILTYQELDEALKSYKDYFTKQMTIIAAASEKLTEDLRKLERPRTPSLYDVLVLFFTVPIPPTATTPPPAQTYSDLVKDWMGKNRYALIVAGVVGLALAVGRSAYIWAKRMTDVVQAKQHVRDKEVVVILGADSPLGPLIVSDLRSKGYIVMASVSSEEAVADIEMIDQGFINALVLNPCDPSSIAPFFRSLQSALSLPFSLAQGGPHRAPLPSELPVLVSLISLLSLTRPNPAVASTPHSLSTLSISNDYLPHLITTHLTPLTIIQSIIPLFRAAGKKALDHNSRASVIITLPGGPNSVGIVGQDPSHAMASAAMAKASEILRRELSVPPGLAGMRVVVIDVGDVSTNPSTHLCGHSHALGSVRKPTDARELSDAIARVVGGNMKLRDIELRTSSNFGQTIEILVRSFVLNLRDWWRGDRFSIGSGAAIYSLTSILPTRMLDFILLMPERMISYQDRIRWRTRGLELEVRERNHEHDERSQAAQHEEESEVENVADQGKEAAAVSKTGIKPPVLPPLACVHAPDIVENQRVPGVASNIPAIPTSTSSSVDYSSLGSEPDMKRAPLVHSDDDEHQTGRIGESWVMEVGARGMQTH